MTGPITRPLEVENDAIPSYPLPGIHANDRSSISSNIRNDNSVNKTMPWIALAMLVSGVAMGLSIGARDTSLEAKRIADRETRLLRLQLDDLRTTLKAQGIKIHDQETP